MTLNEAIEHCREVAEEQEKLCKVNDSFNFSQPKWKKCAKEHRQLEEWLKELRVFKSRKGQWLRMSDEQEDDRYKCSHCGNVVLYKDKMNLYTFNSWCGRCGSYNGREIKVEVAQPKMGHWINKKPRWIPSLSMTMHDAYECSNCGEPGIHWWKHCINCGVRMIEPQESEDKE